MNLILIKGGKSEAVPMPAEPTHGAGLVRQEADRRLRQAGYLQRHIRSLATGAPMPRALRHYKMQVDFVAERLAALDPVPADFASDIYWPAL